MDLQTVTTLSGPKGRIARIAAFVFLAIACALMASSLIGKSHASVEPGDMAHWSLN